MSSLKELKRHLRQEALGRRDALAPDLRIEASLRIAELGASALDFRPGTIISGFLTIRSELAMRPLMANLADRGARLCLPVVLDRETIVFRELVRGAEMVPTGFGTTGPGPEAAVLDPHLLHSTGAVIASATGRVITTGRLHACTRKDVAPA